MAVVTHYPLLSSQYKPQKLNIFLTQLARAPLTSWGNQERNHKCSKASTREDDDVRAGEAHRRVRQPVRASRRGGPAPERGPLRAHPGRPEQQERAPAQAQPRPQARARGPPWRPLRRRVARHRRVHRQGLRRAAAAAGRPLREGPGAFLGPVHRPKVCKAVLHVILDWGRRRAQEGLREGGQGEPGAPGSAAQGEEVLRGRRRRLPRHRRLCVGPLGWGDGGGHRGDLAKRRGAPCVLQVGQRLRQRRDREAVPEEQRRPRRLFLREEGDVHGASQGYSAQVIWTSQCR